MIKMLRLLLATLVFVAALSGSVRAENRPGAIADLRVAKGVGSIADVWFAEPTDRYKHFVLGSNYEAGALVARMRDGRTLTLRLGPDAVFEDRQPRLADLDGDGKDEIVVVKTYLTRGASVAVIGERDGKLVIIAETAPTGRANTWLNPAGIADFDGDGRADIAYVQMPHVLGLLRVVTLRDGKLVEIAQVPGVSNHAIGSRYIGLSAVGDFDRDGVADLAVPSLDRRAIRLLSFKGGRVREIRKIELSNAVAGDLKLVSRGHGGKALLVPLAGGQTQSIPFPPF